MEVEWVKPEGAAFVAGIREGDRILKVNGMPVTASSHQKVLRMISSPFSFTARRVKNVEKTCSGGYYLALTLLGPSRSSLVYTCGDEFGYVEDTNLVVAHLLEHYVSHFRNISSN